MKDIFEQVSKPKIVLGLGFFDSLHMGHKKIIDTIKHYAQVNNIASAIMTFSDNPKSSDKLVYTATERLALLDECKIDFVLNLQFEQVKDWTAEMFLQKLVELTDLRCLICGQDYKFGKLAKGEVNYLNDFCNQRDIECVVVDTVQINGQKISTTNIKKLLQDGELDCANACLGQNYSITSTVERGRGIGKLIVPTINMHPSNAKQLVANGVYGTHTLIDGQWLRSVTNVGGQPTLDSDNCVVETHIIDFDRDLYGQTVVVRFDKRLRDTKKFDDIQKLKEQLLIDSEWRPI